MRQNKSKKWGRKGSLIDLVLIGAAVFVFAIVLLIGFRVQSGLNDQFQASSLLPAEAKTASATLTNDMPGVLDNILPFAMIGLGIVTLILASLVRIHPVFIPLFIIGLVIIIFLTGIYSDVYQEMAASPELSTYADQLTFTGFVLSYLPFIVGIFGFLLMIVSYKVWNTEL